MNSSGVPVLMYHALVDTYEPYMAAVHVETAAFELQMGWLAAHGYRSISPMQLLQALEENQPLPNSVVITFDDGYASLLQKALPILARYGFSATLFLTTESVGWPTYKNLPEFGDSVPLEDRPLTWDEVRVLQAAGWSIEAHSRTHQNHRNLTSAELQQEMGGSKAQIEACLHSAVQFYAFPYGKYTAGSLELLDALNYRAGFSVHPGQANSKDDVRRLPRLEITAQCGLEEFARKVTTGYDSSSEKYRSTVRNILFRSPRLKDFLQKGLGRYSN
ncbi:polysaccharide deacetylase family protein [Hymenobacter wooponensis]|nr:polysaccharide deacetylase family protein [Hymenobacter wooponensis]